MQKPPSIGTLVVLILRIVDLCSSDWDGPSHEESDSDSDSSGSEDWNWTSRAPLSLKVAGPKLREHGNMDKNASRHDMSAKQKPDQKEHSQRQASQTAKGGKVEK